MPTWKEKSGYRAQFQFAGKRRSQSGFATKAKANAWIVAEKVRLATEGSTPTPVAPPLTLATLMEKYLLGAERTLAPKTIAYRKTVFRRFLAEVGNIPVTSLTPEMVEQHLLARPTSANFNKCRTELLRLFNWGIRRQLVTTNPVYLVDKVPVDRTHKVIPTPEQMSRILLAAGPDRPLLLVLFHTMARIDEIMRLKWEDVNFEHKTVTLWTRKRKGGQMESDLMPQAEDLEVVLRGLWKVREQDEWVFFNPKTGTRYQYRAKLMGVICKRAGVPLFGFHCIRHLVASLLYDKKKVSLPVISKLLRHKNLQTTEIYLHAVAPEYRKAMMLLDGDVLKGLSEVTNGEMETNP